MSRNNFQDLIEEWEDNEQDHGRFIKNKSHRSGGDEAPTRKDFKKSSKNHSKNKKPVNN